MAKKVIAFFFVVLLIASLASCKKPTPSPEPTSEESNSTAAQETTLPDNRNTPPSENVPADDFAFEKEKAVELGNTESAIYGRIYVFYQENHIAVLDSYNSVICTFDAHNLAPASEATPDTLIGEDMNFDGYSDLRILYRSNSLNRFYLCWMWDMATKNYVLFEPLSNLPNPSFDQQTKIISSMNKSSRTSATLATYTWQNGDLLPTNFSVVNPERETELASDDIDTQLSIADGILRATVTLTCGKKSSSHWMCKIEDPATVTLLSDSFDETALLHRFEFMGLRPGTTTVILRYAISWETQYIAEKVLNITVKPDMTLSIVEIR